MVPTFLTVLQKRGIGDQASARRQHVTTNGDEIALFVVPNERRTMAPQLLDGFDRAASDFLSEQDRLNILNWSAGPRRGSLGAIEKQSHCEEIARCCSVDVLQHADITRQFHVTHFRGCARLFNQHNFEPDIV